MLFDRDFSHVTNMLIRLPYQICNGGRNCQDYIPDIYHHVIFHVTFDYFDAYNIYFFANQLQCNVTNSMLFFMISSYPWEIKEWQIKVPLGSSILSWIWLWAMFHNIYFNGLITFLSFNLIFKFNLVL